MQHLQGTIALWQTHRSGAGPDRRALTFITEGLGAGRTSVLFDTAGGNRPSAALVPHAWTFDSRQFATWGYAAMGDSLIPGHAHFPLLRFYEQNPKHEWYWHVEDDVAYRGRWRSFFDALAGDTADLLTCHVREQRHEPGWFWWNTLETPAGAAPMVDQVRGLLVIARYSNRALATLVQRCRAGWRGHFEVLGPSLIKHAGLSLADIGGNGPYTPAHRRGHYYTSYSDRVGSLKNIGTVRYRPASRAPGWRRGFLYHPVKPEAPPMGKLERIRAMVKSIHGHWQWRRGRLQDTRGAALDREAR